MSFIHRTISSRTWQRSYRRALGLGQEPRPPKPYTGLPTDPEGKESIEAARRESIDIPYLGLFVTRERAGIVVTAEDYFLMGGGRRPITLPKSVQRSLEDIYHAFLIERLLIVRGVAKKRCPSCKRDLPVIIHRYPLRNGRVESTFKIYCPTCLMSRQIHPMRREERFVPRP